ncbi:MAG: hypothetical protein KIT15_07080 [Xanthobacteraceae bacterium]|nr:hypothetical protein [Xanthobacteraceae bacterium]MBX3550595.1 hypothetical protein [Xanthobacteraceae bacterium]MCW5674328.1 hypothetical protein [Xanthobacteraceae bacterium]
MTRDEEKQTRAEHAQELISAIDYLLPAVNKLSPAAAQRLAEANSMLQQALINDKNKK